MKQNVLSHIRSSPVQAFLGVLLICGIGVLGMSDALAQEKKKNKGRRPALVKIDVVVKEDVRQTTPVLGRIVAEVRSDVAARIAAALDQVKVRVGDRVQAQQIIAELKTDRLKGLRDQWAATVNQRRAALTTRKAQVQTARRTVNRLARLKKSKSAAFRVALYEDSLSALATAKSQIAEAAAAIERAKADLALAELNLSYSTIRAPFDGIVTQIHRQPGAYISLGMPLITLMDDRSLEIEADVPTDRLARLSAGLVIDAEIGSRRFKTAVRALIPDESTRTRTRAVRFTISTPSDMHGLAANQSVTVLIPVGNAREIVTVHKDAVINRKGKNMVFVVADGKAKPRPIEIGDGIGNRFAVVKGLQVGDKVVIRGNERLFPGQSVRF